MKNYSKKEIYDYDSCPICQASFFYMCEVLIDTGEDGLDMPPCIDIFPSKPRFTLIETSSYQLPWYWAACAECGYVHTKVPSDYLGAKIRKWLKGSKIDNTTKTICAACSSKNALNWSFESERILRTAILFNKTPSVKHIFGKYKAIDIDPNCNLCLDCGFTFLRIDKASIVEAAHKRYLGCWSRNA